MNRLIVATLVMLWLAGPAFGGSTHEHKIPTLKDQDKTSVSNSREYGHTDVRTGGSAFGS